MTNPPSEAAKLLANELYDRFVYGGWDSDDESTLAIITAHDAEIRREALEDGAEALGEFLLRTTTLHSSVVKAAENTIRSLITKPSKEG